MHSNPQYREHVGKIFGTYKIVGKSKHQHLWLVKCLTCQFRSELSVGCLQSSSSNLCFSCKLGDSKKVKSFLASTKHRYCAMMRRCYDINNKGYKRYGARGITVCEEWRNPDTGIFAYRNWILSYPSGISLLLDAHYQIDRIDNNDNYDPKNCRIVSPEVNMRNSTASRHFLEIVGGERLSLRQCVEKYGTVNYARARARLDRGYTLIEAALLPSIPWTSLNKLRKLNELHPVTTTLEEDLIKLGISHPA